MRKEAVLDRLVLPLFGCVASARTEGLRRFPTLAASATEKERHALVSISGFLDIG